MVIYIITLYTLIYQEDKYFISLLVHFKHTVKIYYDHPYTQIIIKKILIFFFREYKNESKQHKFRQQKIKKSDVCNKNKKISNKILVSKKEKYGKYNLFKYFIGYNDNDVIKPLYLEPSQMTGYINKFNEHESKNKNKNKNRIIMSLKVKDKKLFINYNKIQTKIEKLMGIDFNTKPTYGDDNKYIKTKIKIYEDNITTNFYNIEGPKKSTRRKNTK